MVVATGHNKAAFWSATQINTDEKEQATGSKREQDRGGGLLQMVRH